MIAAFMQLKSCDCVHWYQENPRKEHKLLPLLDCNKALQCSYWSGVRECQVRSWNICLYCLVINPSLHQHHASSVLLMETHRKPEFPFPIDNKESSISFYWGVTKGGLVQNEVFHRCPPAITSCGFPGGSNNKKSAFSAGDSGSILGLGRSPGEGNHNPL